MTIRCLLILLLLLPGAALAQEELTVVTLEAPPMVFKQKGRITGMAAELTVEGLKRAGYDASLVLAPWKRAVFMATNGEADALFFAVFNPEREQMFHYPATPILTLEIVVLKRAKSAIVFDEEASGLSRWTLGIGRGFAYGPKVQRFIDQARFQQVEMATSNEINFDKLINGRIDIILAVRTLAHSLMKRAPGKADFVKDPNGDVAILDSMDAFLIFSRKMRTADDARRFSEAILSMQRDGTYQAITDRYH